LIPRSNFPTRVVVQKQNKISDLGGDTDLFLTITGELRSGSSNSKSRGASMFQILSLSLKLQHPFSL